MDSSPSHQQTVYEIQVQGELNQDWQQCFNGLAVTLSSTTDQLPVTVLSGPVADQAALRGMLCKLWDLNLTLISVRRIEADDRKEKLDD